MTVHPMLLAACLIVRDEADHISDCLASLRHLVDEVIVYDTGSLDRTVSLARSAGATVIDGYWDDDFGRARNAAAGHTEAIWILSVDADEIVRADRDRLRAALIGRADVDGFVLDIVQSGDVDGANRYVNHAVKLFRRTTSRWSGQVHERVVGAVDGPYRVTPMSSEVIHLRHDGYRDADDRRAKSTRNAAISLAELRNLQGRGAGGPEDFARILLDLGRSLIGSGQGQDAADCFVTIRSLTGIEGSAQWLEATELLARLALGGGQCAEAAELAEQLRAAGGATSYADWLMAQAIAPLGRAAEALQLLGPLTEIVDSAGRRYAVAELAEMRALVTVLAAGE